MFDVSKPNNDLNMLSPFMRVKLEIALRDLWANGIDMYVFEGWRSPSRQSFLYEQGRSAPGKIITNSKPWTSFHQFGVAIDLVYKINNRWSWEGDFTKPAQVMKKHGFEWGGDFKTFKDMPHYQITGGFTIQEAKAITDQFGVQAFWLAVNERSSKSIA